MKELMKKRILLAALLAVMLMIFCFQASALGVSPAFRTVMFSPNTDLELEFEMINSEHADITVMLGSEGDLAANVFFNSQKFELAATTPSMPFKVMLRFPESLPPGIHKTNILVVPVPVESETMFSLSVAPKIPLTVRVPYPSKYAIIEASILDSDEGNPIPAYISFDNLGSEDIADAGAVIKVKDLASGSVKQVSMPRAAVPVGAFRKLSLLEPLVLERGAYTAEMLADYDGIREELQANFSVGKPAIRVSELGYEKIIAGEIGRFSFRVLNDWNIGQQVRGAVLLEGVQHELAAISLEPGEEKEAEAFIDAAYLPRGSYNATLVLDYSGKIDEHPFLLIIEAKQAVREEEGLGADWKLMIFAATILLLVIILALGLVLIIRKRRREKEEPPLQNP